jgi:hypothetical protein
MVPAPTSAGAITVTLHTSQSRNMSVPLFARDQPARQRRIKRGYVRLLHRAEAVCRSARREGRKRHMPAVTANKALVTRFNRSRNGVNQLLRRLRLPPAPRIRDFSQLRSLWVLKRVRRRGGVKGVRATPLSTTLNCRFD